MKKMTLLVATLATTLLLSGTGGFNCRIQCQQIGLKGDLVDHFDNLGDIIRRFINLQHRF